MSMSKNTEINRNIKRKLAMGGVVGDYALYDPATEMQLTGARWWGSSLVGKVGGLNWGTGHRRTSKASVHQGRTGHDKGSGCPLEARHEGGAGWSCGYWGKPHEAWRQHRGSGHVGDSRLQDGGDSRLQDGRCGGPLEAIGTHVKGPRHQVGGGHTSAGHEGQPHEVPREEGGPGDGQVARLADSRSAS